MQSPLYQFRLESAPDLAFIVQRPGSDPSAAARGPSEWFMKLRCKPDPARTADVWAEGNPLVCEGEAVTAVRMNARDEEGFAWIRTASGAEGFLRSEYLALAPQRAPQERRTEVLWKAGLPNVSYADATRRTVTSLERGACTFVPDIACAPGSGHHVLVVRISKCNGEEFSIETNSNNDGGSAKNIFQDGGFLGFMSCDQADVQREGEFPKPQMGLFNDGCVDAGGWFMTMGFAYQGNQNYHALKKVKSRSHSVRFDLFCGHSDTRLFDVAVDGCKSYPSSREESGKMIRSHFAENPDHVFNDFLKKPKHFVVKLAEAAGYMLEIEEYFCQPLD